MRKVLAAAFTLFTLLAFPAFAQQQNFILVNQTGSAITAVNVSPASTDDWGPDILEGQVIEDGQETTVQFPPDIASCELDVRVTYDSGDASEVRNVNLCDATRITVTYDEDEEATRFTIE